MIKAHEINQTINLDIYGSGNDEYTSYLQNIVKDAGADDYIHFKGRCNLEKIYPHYELFASFSLWETFGLSLMEAVGDGLAMVGLDVRYGNRLFIHQDENGYLVDFDIETDFQNKDKLCERTAAAIVKIFEDDDRLKKFHENSYMIAEEYKEHVIESKWMQLIKIYYREKMEYRMEIHITNLHNIGGTATLAMDGVVKIAKTSTSQKWES